jgi:hypothetical protein
MEQVFADALVRKSSRSVLRPPAQDSAIGCCPSDSENCFLHLHSATIPHNFGRIFSSDGVGSIGPVLRSYEDFNMFLSTGASVTWTMVLPNAHKYEIGDRGGIVVVVNDEDEETVDFASYSTDLGKTWYVNSSPVYPVPDRPCDDWLIYLNFNCAGKC